MAFRAVDALFRQKKRGRADYAGSLYLYIEETTFLARHGGLRENFPASLSGTVAAAGRGL
jgi:hypothetical protein